MRDDNKADVSELYRVDFANPTVQVRLNHTLRAAVTGESPAEEVLSSFIAVNPVEPRKVLYSTNNVPVKGYTSQSIRVVSVDAPSTGTVVGTPTGAQFYFLWAPDGDTIMVANDPDQTSVTSSFLTSLSVPTVMTKLTPERFPGATVTFTLTPFLP